MVAATIVNHSAGPSPLRGQNHSFIQSSMASPPTLQGNPGLDELSASRGRGQLSSHIPVQYQASPVSGSTTRPTLVGIPRTDYTITSPPSTMSSQHDYHFRCLQHRLGSMLGGHNYWGDMVSTGDDAPHQLPGALSCISSSAMLSESREQYDHPSQVGQRDSSHLYQSDGRNSLQAFVLTSTCLVGMVHSEEPVPTCRTSTTSAECTGRPRIPKPQDQCDWMINPQLFDWIQDQMGPCQVDLFASCLTRQLPRYYSWRIDPEAEAVDAFTQDWSYHKGFANPPWCLIPRCLSQVHAQKARLILLTPLWPSQSWYPVVLDMLEDIPRLLPTQEDLNLYYSTQGRGGSRL